jgi:hypothetical protein
MAVTSQNKDHWYLFLLFPFLAGIIAIRNYRESWAKNIIWAFIVFYGFTFSIPTEVSINGSSSDINRYTLQVRNLYKIDLKFQDVVKLYQDNEDIDILKLTIAIVVSRVTNSSQVLTAIYGFIFGFFFSRNMWFLIERMKGKIKPAALLLLIAYILVDPVWNINGFRFYTATQIFIYGLLPFIFEGRKKSIFICALSLLVHFSFLLPVGVLFMYILAGNRTMIYFIFFLASIVSSGINIGVLNKFIEANVPTALADRTATYRNEDKVGRFRSDTEDTDIAKPNWYVQWYSKALQWPLMVFLSILVFYRKKIKLANEGYLNSLCFTLLFWGVANILATLPSGTRFLVIAAFSALPLIILYVQNIPHEKFLNNKVLIASPVLLLFIIVSIRFGFLTISVNTLISNPLVVLFTDYNIALNELIK